MPAHQLRLNYRDCSYLATTGTVTTAGETTDCTAGPGAITGVCVGAGGAITRGGVGTVTGGAGIAWIAAISGAASGLAAALASVSSARIIGGRVPSALVAAV